MQTSRLRAAALLLALYVSGCRGATEGPQLRPIRVMDTIQATSSHILVANSNGYFREQGLAPTINYTSAAKFAMDALNGHAVDYATVVEMNVAQALFQTTDLSILSEMSEHVRSLKILGRKDRGVLTAGDLVGRRVGVLFGISAHLFLVNYLKAMDVDAFKVTFQNLAPPEAGAAFKSGDIDAIVAWQPQVFTLSTDPALKDKVSIITDDDKYWPNQLLLATRKSYLESHSDEAKRFLTAILKADDFIHTNPADTQALMAKHLSLEPAAVKSFFDEISFRVQIRPRLIDTIAKGVQWQATEFQQGRQPLTSDYRSLIAPLLQELRPSVATSY